MANQPFYSEVEYEYFIITCDKTFIRTSYHKIKSPDPSKLPMPPASWLTK